jgi:hypothetical protein
MKSFKYKGVTYKVGDKVLLTNKRPSNWNTDELMDKYLGRVVTISNIVDILYPNRETYFLIEEETFCTFEPENIVKKVSGTFFKTLPNDFTGTIDVVGGYIGKPQILDEEEKRYLEGVIRPFRDKAKYIEKIGNSLEEYIWIEIKGDDIKLPFFKANTMYKSMELEKRYTLEELGLFEEE